MSNLLNEEQKILSYNRITPLTKRNKILDKQIAELQERRNTMKFNEKQLEELAEKRQQLNR